MGLSRNKVAVPEGAAGTPPFWSLVPRLNNHCNTFLLISLDIHSLTATVPGENIGVIEVDYDPKQFLDTD